MTGEILQPETHGFRTADGGWLILVRHGETAWNAERRIQGATDIPLSEAGRAQAECLAERLRGLPCTAVYSSDMQRAVDTAAPICAALGVPVRQDARLRERDCGVLEGRTWPDILALDPNRPPGTAMDLDRYEGVEPLAALKARVSAVMHELSALHRGGLTVVVTHGAVLSAFFEEVSRGRLAIGRIRLTNASISMAGRLQEQAWRIPVLNYTEHLEAADWKNAGAASPGA